MYCKFTSERPVAACWGRHLRCVGLLVSSETEAAGELCPTGGEEGRLLFGSPSSCADASFRESVFLPFCATLRVLPFAGLPAAGAGEARVLDADRFIGVGGASATGSALGSLAFFFSGRRSSLLANARASLTAGSFMTRSMVLSSCTSMPSYCGDSKTSTSRFFFAFAGDPVWFSF